MRTITILLIFIYLLPSYSEAATNSMQKFIVPAIDCPEVAKKLNSQENFSDEDWKLCSTELANEVNDFFEAKALALERDKNAINTCDFSPFTPSFSIGGKSEIDGVSFNYETKVKYLFDKAEDGGRPIINVTEIVTNDFSDMRTAHIKVIDKNIPVSSCNDRYKAHGHSLNADGNGAAQGKVSLKYENWACSSFHVPCCKWLKCRRCKKEIKTEIGRKTVKALTTISPVIKDNDVILVSSTEIDERGGIPNTLLNIVGVLTHNVGSKWMLDEYRGTISDIRSKLVTEQYDIPIEKNRPLMVLSLQSAKFQNNAGRLELEVISEGPTRPEIACAFRKAMTGGALR